jgi:hypothetical protein
MPRTAAEEDPPGHSHLDRMVGPPVQATASKMAIKRPRTQQVVADMTRAKDTAKAKARMTIQDTS